MCVLTREREMQSDRGESDRENGATWETQEGGEMERAEEGEWKKTLEI